VRETKKKGQKAQVTRLGIMQRQTSTPELTICTAKSRWNPKSHLLRNLKLETKSIRDKTCALVRQPPVILHYSYHSQQHDIMSPRRFAGGEMHLQRPRVGKPSLREKDRRRMRCVCDSKCVLQTDEKRCLLVPKLSELVALPSASCLINRPYKMRGNRIVQDERD